jgi:hypothetical protein
LILNGEIKKWQHERKKTTKGVEVLKQEIEEDE